MIPAAGRSTRMRGLIRTAPKALLAIAGRPLIAHLLDRLSAPVTDVCIVAAPDGYERLRQLGDRHGSLSLHYVVQSAPLGVAHAVLGCSSLVRGAFLVVMGDCYYERTLASFVLRWRETGDSGAVLVEPADEAGGQPMGLVELSDSRVSRIFKAPWTDAIDWRVCGAFLLPELYFSAAADTPRAASGEFELEDVVTRLTAEGVTFSAIPYEGWRRNINTPVDLATVQERLARSFRLLPDD